MATGDILSVVIPTSGWWAEITIEGLNPGGTYAMGLGANPDTDPDPTAAKIILTVISKSKAEDESDTTITRNIYGTKFLRKPYPDQATPDETDTGTDVVVRVRLSEPVYSKDKAGGGMAGTDPVAAIQSGFYTQGGTPNNPATIQVTNNSTEGYLQPVANHSTPPYRRHTGNVEGGVVAFEAHGQSGRPVRFVKVTVTDEGAHSASQTITAPTIVAGYGDQVPVIEYRYSISQSTFTQGDKLTVNFKAYAWVGDTPLDSGDGVNAVLSPNYSPQEHLCDKNATYGVTIALVDPAGSDSGANTVYDESAFDPGTAYKFLTIAKAARAIRDYNNTNRSRDDVGAGIIYLNAGSYAWMGSTQAGGYGTTPKTWLTVKAAPGVARSAVAITSTSGDRDPADRVKLETLEITTTAVNVLDSTIAAYLKDVKINTTSNGIFNTTSGRVYMEHCAVPAFTQGLRHVTGTNCCFPLVRGCDLSGFARTILCYTVIGNYKAGITTPASQLLLTELSGMAPPVPKGFIIAFNRFYGYRTDFQILSCGEFNSNTHGGAIVQNIFESAQNGGGQPLADIGSSDSVTTNTPIKNYIIWHNVFLGQRCTVGYNDDTPGDELKTRLFWSHVGNYWARWANKGDEQGTGNANRVGAWTITSQVLGNGDVKGQVMFSLPSNFFAEFPGIFSHQPTTSEAVGYPKFVDDNSYSGASDGTGDGDYHTQSDSPLRNKVKRLVLPYDIEGNVRSAGFNDAGAYTSPAPATAGAFGAHLEMVMRLGVPWV